MRTTTDVRLRERRRRFGVLVTDGKGDTYVARLGTNLTVVDGVIDGAGGGASGFTPGSVIFASALGELTEDNANFFWDNTNNRLGIGTATPVTDVVLSHAAIGALPITAASTNPAIGVRLANPTAATLADQTQASPALEFVGASWDTGDLVSRTMRYAIYMVPVPASVNGSYLAFRPDLGVGGGWDASGDDVRIGRVTSGDAPSLRFRDGNILFRNSSRGIYFTAAPLTDTSPTTHYIAASTTGRIDLVPLVGGGATEAYVNIEHNQFGASTGTVPALNLRGFDSSTLSPVMTVRHRAVPGGTAAAGFGASERYQASSTTTSNQDQGAFDCVWSDATHATRSADFVMRLVASAAALAEKFRFRSSGLLTFGGTTSAQPALKPSSTELHVRLADDSGYTKLQAGDVHVNGTLTGHKGEITVTLDGGGSVLATGAMGYFRLPRAGTITKWTLLSADGAATSGSIVLDLWKDTYANYPPTVADTITASAKPTLSAAIKNEDSTLSGWTTAFSAGDCFGVNIDSVSTITRAVLILEVRFG